MSIKNILLMGCCLFSLTQLSAQENTATATTKSRSNVLKINVLSPLSIGYERGLGKHFSIAVNGLYLPALSYGAPADAYGHLELSEASVGFSAEARYYTSKTKSPLNGFYVGGFYVTRSAKYYIHKTATTGTTVVDAEITIPSGLTMGGMMLGKQRIRGKGFTTDFSIGGGYYVIGNIPTVDNDSNEAFKMLSRLSKLSSGFGPRVNFSLGYAF